MVIKTSTIILDDYVKMIQDIQKAVESHPPNMIQLESILYKINSPSFKYPEMKKCCKKCNATQQNKRLREAFDILKTISFDDLFENIMAKIERVGWVYKINDWSIKNKDFRRVKS